METSGVVYEVDCNNFLNQHKGETGRRLWRKIAKKDKKITGLSQYMKTSGHFSAWMITGEYKWKKRKFNEAARIISQDREQLMNKKDERKTICNL